MQVQIHRKSCLYHLYLVTGLWRLSVKHVIINCLYYSNVKDGQDETLWYRRKIIATFSEDKGIVFCVNPGHLEQSRELLANEFLVLLVYNI